MSLLEPQEAPVIHQFGDRQVKITPQLLGLVLTDVIQRLLKESPGVMNEPLDQIVLNKYTYLMLKNEVENELKKDNSAW